MKHTTDEKEYPLSFFHVNSQWSRGLIVTLLVIGISGGFYLWYSQNSNDAAPDSIPGFGYAFLGTGFLLLAGLLYSIRRRSHNKRQLGKLNSALHWHVFFAIIGLALLFMHSFGNFNPRTGTYALYGLIALVISGFVGRTLDHLMPRLIAHEVHKALTAQGEDRIETISQQLRAIVAHNTEPLYGHQVEEASLSEGNQRSTTQNLAESQKLIAVHESDRPVKVIPITPADLDEHPLHTPWDLAYISLEATPQELNRLLGRHRLVPDKQSALTHPAAYMPGTQEQITQLQTVQHAMQREYFYRHIIRYWRLFHIALALLTLGLTLWHLIYAAQLLLH